MFYCFLHSILDRCLQGNIYEAVWDDIPVNVDAKVECMIYSIRKKLREYTDRQYIQTVWGVGYKFDPET